MSARIRISRHRDSKQAQAQRMAAVGGLHPRPARPEPPPRRHPARARRRNGDQERPRRLYPPQRRRQHLGGRGAPYRRLLARRTKARCTSRRTTRSIATRPSSTSPTKWGRCDDRTAAVRIPAAAWATTRWCWATACREWCGHAPVLEEDIALANTALDLIGQTQLWLGLAGEVEGKGRDADDLAFHARRLGFPQPAAGRTAQRRFRPDDDAAVPVRCLASADAEGADDVIQ